MSEKPQDFTTVFFETVGANLSGPDDSIFDSIWDWISGVASSIWNAVTGFFGWVGEEIKELFSWLWEGISSWFIGVWNGIVGWFQSLWNRLGSWFSTLWSNISTWFSNLWSNFTSWLANLWGNISSWFSRVWSGLGNWFSNLWSNITSAFSNLWTNVSTWFSNLWGNLGNFFSNLWGNLTGWFSNLWQNISSWFSSLWDKIQSTYNWVVGWLSEHIPTIIQDAFGWFIDKVLNFGGWIGKLFDAIWSWLSRDVPGHSPWYEGIFEWISMFLYRVFVESPVKILKYLTVGFMQTIQQFVVPLTSVMWEYFDMFINSITSVTAPVGAMAPEHGLNIMSTLNKVSATVIAGLLGLSLAGELTVLATKLGFGHVAAMIYDLTNYKVLTGALVTALSAAAVAIPLRHYYQSKFRPNIPSIRDAMDFFASDDIGESVLNQILAYMGIPDQFHAAYADSAYRSPSPFQLKTAAQDGAFDEGIFAEELRRAGYHPNVRKMFIDSFKKASTSNLKSVMIASATGRFKQGITDKSGLTSELKILNVGDELIPLYVAGANLDYATAFVGEMEDAFTNGVRSGNLTLDDYRQALLSLGIRPERVEAKVLVEKMRINPKAKKTPTAIPTPYFETAEGKVWVDTIRLRRTKNTITREQEINALTSIGMSTVYAEIIADNDDARLIEKISIEPEKVVAPYETTDGKVKLATIRSKRRKKSIDRTEELTQLAALGVPEYLAKAYADNDDVAIMEKVPTETLPEVPLYETEAGKIKVDTIRRARRKMTISERDERQQLAALGMADWLVDVIVENDTIRMAEKGGEE